jgi:hypothetical protein
MDQVVRSAFVPGDPRMIGWIDGLPNARIEDDLDPGHAESAEAVAPPQTFWERRIAAESSFGTSRP